MITLKNVEKQYSNFKLGPINLVIKDSQLVCITGSSGSGKSTLVKLITNNIQPDLGEILYNSINQDEIIYIPQNGTLFNHLTVYENLILKNKYSDEQLIEALKAVNLDRTFLDKYPYNLSGGQRQRIDLVRALLGGYRLLIMDESMSALDGVNKREISAIIQQLNIAVIYITHDIEQAYYMDASIITLDNGVIC